jgi:hypothetical protein
MIPAGRVSAVIYVYGDDGSDEKKERVTAISVVAGLEEWWQDVEDQWKVRCGGIPFHATDCESNQGDYRSIPHDDNKAMYRDLTGILAASNLGGLGIAIDITAQRKIFPYSLELAYYRAFLEGLNRCATMAKNVGEIAKLTFDISTENEFNAALLYKIMRDGDPELFEWLHPEISFVPWRESSRVQAGDLLAFEAWKALDHTVGAIKRKRKSWELLRATQRFETLSYSEDWFRDLKRDIESGNLGKKVNFTADDYKQWLSDRKRHHDLSNLFQFLDWTRRRDEQQGK